MSNVKDWILVLFICAAFTGGTVLGVKQVVESREAVGCDCADERVDAAKSLAKINRKLDHLHKHLQAMDKTGQVGDVGPFGESE